MAAEAGWRPLLAVAAGGAVGASLRYALLLAFPTGPGAFPVTIFAENVLGSFLLGIVIVVLLRRFPAAAHLQVFLTTGVIGSFTTFSAVSLDLVLLAEEGRWSSAGAYAAGSIGVGLIAAFGGLVLGRRLTASSGRHR